MGSADQALETIAELNSWIERHPDRGCTWFGQRISRCIECPMAECPREAVGDTVRERMQA